MINGECGARCAGDQDWSQCWSAYGVSHHSLRWDLLCWPVRPSVAGGHTASVHQLVSTRVAPACLWQSLWGQVL